MNIKNFIIGTLIVVVICMMAIWMLLYFNHIILAAIVPFVILLVGMKIINTIDVECEIRNERD